MSPYRPQITVLKLLTTIVVAKDVVALLREGEFVDSVSDVARLEQVTSVLACVPPVRKTLHVCEQPVHQIST